MTTLPKWHRGRHAFPNAMTDRIDAWLNAEDEWITRCSIKLSPDDMAWATEVGKRRRYEGRRLGLSNATGYGGNASFETDIDGACYEIGYCRWAKVDWPARINTFHQADVGDDIQIRGTRLHNGCLILRKEDPTSHIYWLLVGTPPDLFVIGHIKGVDGMKPEWLKLTNGLRECWMVPQYKLEHPDSRP